jgi:hypothetical protein
MPWKEPVPGREPIRVGPDGRIMMGSVDSTSGIVTLTECNADRMRLASIDNDRFARDLVNDANRANATFYTIDPRGLAVFDLPIYRDPDEVGLAQNVAVDQQSLRRRHDAMADLAAGTDGIAVLNSNDLDGGLRRISEDLSSYYLLGYYSTNAKLDGRFRAITVRVKRPGVEVRARRGYRAPTEAEVSAARRSSVPGRAAAEPVTAIATALASLARIRSEARFRLHAAPVRDASGGVSMWIAGELPQTPGWTQGGRVALEITGAGAAATSQVAVQPGERAFLTSIALETGASAVEVRGRLTNPDATVTPFAETLRVDVAPAAAPQPLIYRRGPATGNRLQPAADFQFSRSERARVELPLGAGVKPSTGRLLDKAGVEIKVPVTVSERTDAASGQRWLTADIILAPLGPGDYVVELAAIAAGGAQKVLTAFRVTR